MAQKRDSQPDSERLLLSQKAYADRKGWSKQYVNQLVKRGRIPLHENKIDPVFALIMALARAMLTEDEPSVYETPGFFI